MITIVIPDSLIAMFWLFLCVVQLTIGLAIIVSLIHDNINMKLVSWSISHIIGMFLFGLLLFAVGIKLLLVILAGVVP